MKFVQEVKRVLNTNQKEHESMTGAGKKGEELQFQQVLSMLMSVMIPVPS